MNKYPSPRVHNHYFRYSRAKDLPDAWAAWLAVDKCGYGFASSIDNGGLVFMDNRPEAPEVWRIADESRFPACTTIDRYKVQLRAYFDIWGGRTGPNLPYARRQLAAMKKGKRA